MTRRARAAGRAILVLLLALACVLCGDAASFAAQPITTPTCQHQMDQGSGADAGCTTPYFGLLGYTWTLDGSNNVTGITHYTANSIVAGGATYWPILGNVECSTSATQPGALSGSTPTWNGTSTALGNMTVDGQAHSSITWDGTKTCPAGQVVVGIMMTVQRQTDFHNFSIQATFGYAQPVAYCTTGSFTDGAASYVNGQLAVRFKWNSASTPATWSVYAPDPGSATGTPVGSVSSTSDAVSAASGYFYHSFSLASLATATARIVAPDLSPSQPGCYLSVTVNTAVAVDPTGSPDTGSNDGGSTSTNCGWSLNPFHYLKCLFWPSSSFQQWNDLQTTAKTHPPLSVMVGGAEYADAIYNGLFDNSAGCGGVSTDITASCRMSFDPNGANWDFIGAAGDDMQTSWGQIVYHLLQVAVWVPALIGMWHRLSASFGGRETP